MNWDTTATSRMFLRKSGSPEFQTQHCLYPHHLAEHIGFPNCWKPRPRLKGAFAAKWRGSSPCGKRFTPDSVQSLSRTTLICPSSPLGNSEASELFGSVNFVLRLNAEFAAMPVSTRISWLMTSFTFPPGGRAHWFRRVLVQLSHGVSPTASVALGKDVAAIVK